MSRLRIGVVGAGHFGRFHTLKLATSRRAVLTGVHDRDPARAAAVAKEGRAPVLDWPDLLGACDALVVATPAETHFDLAARSPARRPPRAGGKTHRRNPRRGRRPRSTGRVPPPRAAGRPPPALLRRAPGDQQPHAAPALHRLRAHRPLQAARHRRLGHPRPHDPRPRPRAVPGRKPDRKRGRRRRPGRQRPRGHRQRPGAVRERLRRRHHREPHQPQDRAQNAAVQPGRLHVRRLHQPQADDDRPRRAACPSPAPAAAGSRR